MKIVNLQGMTTAERLAYLQEITQDIYNHLYDDFIWTSLSEYTPDGSYSFSALNNYTDGAEVKPYQIVYFSNNGWVALIDTINEAAQTFTVINGYQVKGDKGDKGDTGNTGAKGETGSTALECQMIDSTSVPMQYNGVTIEFSKFSRNPVVGEVCNTFVNYTSSAIYAVSIRVMTLTDSSANCRYEQVVNFTNILPASSKKQLYEHLVQLNINTSSNTSIVNCVFSWISNDSSILYPAPKTIEEFCSVLKTKLNSNKCIFFGFIETTDGATVSNNNSEFAYMFFWDNDAIKIRTHSFSSNNIHSINLITFVNSLGEYTITFDVNAAYAIGAGEDATNAAVLYSDKNGVLLDTPESLKHDFAALKAAGSDESKILDSINKVGSMNI